MEIFFTIITKLFSKLFERKANSSVGRSLRLYTYFAMKALTNTIFYNDSKIIYIQNTAGKIICILVPYSKLCLFVSRKNCIGIISCTLGLHVGLAHKAADKKKNA